MAYHDGFLAAVPTANKDAYAAFCRTAKTVMTELGALEVLEFWGDDVPDGETNSLNSAVLRKDDETVVMSLVTWPSKDVRDAAYAKMGEDPRMGEMPLDGSRMIFGGFVKLDV